MRRIGRMLGLLLGVIITGMTVRSIGAIYDVRKKSSPKIL